MVDDAETSQAEGRTTAGKVPAQRAGGQRAEPAKAQPSIAESLLAQATAALALAVALIYAAGGLSLALKLWFLRVPWTTVLGQLPHDPLIITAVGQVVVPCLAVGIVLGALIDWFSGMRAGDRTPGSQSRWLQSAWQDYLDTTGGKFLGRTVLVAAVSVALIPCLCSVSGAFLLPPVFLCNPKFFHPVGGREVPGYMTGNLIGSTDQWIYIAQFGESNGQVDFRTITAVPVGAVRLQAIGQGSGCHDLPG